MIIAYCDMLKKQAKLYGGQLQYAQDANGDGIPDNIDLDDDNDGIPDSIEQPQCNAVTDTWVVNSMLNNNADQIMIWSLHTPSLREIDCLYNFLSLQN